MINKESYLSEESQVSSAMSLELQQKVNDQFQRKKMEFYKMYNKNPKDYKESRADRYGKNRKITYNIQGEIEASHVEEGADEPPDIQDYTDDEEEMSPEAKKEEKEAKKKLK